MSAPVVVPATGHIGLNVSQLDRSIDFYRAVFGFDLIRRSADEARPYAFLGHAGAIVVTLWQQSGGAFVTDRPGLHHLSFQAASLEDVRAAEDRVRAQGARLHHDGIVAHAEGADSGGLFFEDPDGIRLEIFTRQGVAGSPVPHADGPTCGFL
jgi:lactoylglutathione lyase